MATGLDEWLTSDLDLLTKQNILSSEFDSMFHDSHFYEAQEKLHQICVDNYIYSKRKDIDQLLEFPIKLTSHHKGIIYSFYTLQARWSVEEECVPIHEEYAEAFLQAKKDYDEWNSNRQYLSSFQRALLNEANTTLELHLMTPKALRNLIGMSFENDRSEFNRLMTSSEFKDIYDKAAIKAGAFLHKHKKAVDILNKHLFLKMLVKK